MRTFFLLVVAANLAFFAWTTYFSPQDATSDPRPLGQQLDPDKLRILSGGDAAPAAGPAPPPAPKPAPEPLAVAACIEWGGFAIAEAPRAETALEPLALGPRLSQRRSEETASWWVYLAPEPSLQAAQKMADQLKKRGVDDVFVMQEAGRWRWALSLGVFSSEEAASNHREALRAKGVDRARVRSRDVQVQKVWLQVRGAEPALRARLMAIVAGFEGTELRDCQ